MDLVVSGLVKERHNVLSRLRDHEAICKELEMSLVSLDAALKHFGHYPDGSYVPKAHLSVGLFYKAELPSMIMRIFRDNLDGLYLADLITEICRQKGWQTDNKQLRRHVSAKTTRILNKKRLKGQLERVGDALKGIWRLRNQKQTKKTDS